MSRPALHRILLSITVALLLTITPTASATLPPPSVRLAVMFDRLPWQNHSATPWLFGPGHLVERWES